MNNWQKKKINDSQAFQTVAYSEINELIFKRREGKYITLLDGTKLIEFVSCSYLGLDLDPRIIQASIKNITQCGVTFPSARTRIQAESFPILENLLNKIFCHGHSTIFASLHLGHLGLLPMLGSGELPSFPCNKNGFLFILDKTVHSSIQINRALMGQFGAVELIDFTDRDDITNLFKKASRIYKTPIAIADSIGSMGGIAPIEELFALSEEYQGYVYLDDAHGTSIYGHHGCGYVLQQLGHTFHPRLILASSLAKSFGAIAGVIILPTKADAEILKQFSPTYVFSGPPALAIIDAAIESANIHLSEEIHELQAKLHENINYFDYLLCEYIVNSSMTSPIRGVFIGNEFNAIQANKKLRERGFAVTAAMYPTVAKGCSMLRIALSATHTKDQIFSLCEHIKEIMSDFDKAAILMCKGNS